uniref:Uncharacterized protein n=1 Tax=Anopheles culicifacies TaxID=139723 RepID=A0A182LTB6_9DIPT
MDGGEEDEDDEELLEVIQRQTHSPPSDGKRRWVILLDLVRRWIRTVFALARNRMAQAMLSPWAENNNYLFSYSSITTSSSSSSTITTTSATTATICTGNGREWSGPAGWQAKMTVTNDEQGVLPYASSFASFADCDQPPLLDCLFATLHGGHVQGLLYTPGEKDTAEEKTAK